MKHDGETSPINLDEENHNNHTHGSDSVMIATILQNEHNNNNHMGNGHDNMHTDSDHSSHMHGNPHDPGSAQHGEHSALFDLVPYSDATHVAVNNGSWFDTNTWANGEIPEDNAQVLIQHGVSVNYDDVSSTRLFTVRVDGELNFATDTDSQMIVDTMVVGDNGSLIIGTEDNPVQSDVNVDIIIANNGDIDVSWDPTLLSRGVVTHGTVRMHGQEKTTHLKVSEDPMAGDTSITLNDAPEGWQVGDTIVLAGTHYDGYKWDNSIRDTRHHEPEDEVLTITEIDGNVIHFDTALQFNHDTPRADLKTSVANYTRNISIESEDGAASETHHRGHVMFMHNDDVDVRYVEFHELGRTDKSETALNASEFDHIASDSNVKGRYSMHFHRTGVDDAESPAIAEGNAVFGSPGWGYVHHDSNAIMHDNASYNTFGAGFVAETGNEIGEWSGNIAIYAKGTGWASPKNGNDVANFDMGKTGSGFYFQGRMVEAFDNIASSTNSGFTYFHRGRYDDTADDGLDGNIRFDASAFSLPEALDGWNRVGTDDAPILNFKGNESFASNYGFFVEKANTSQGHDVRTVLEDFTAWDVVSGAHLAYTSHYLLKDFDVIGTETRAFRSARDGIELGINSSDITVVNAKIDGFETGIDISDRFTGNANGQYHLKQHVIIDAEITNSTRDYNDYQPDTVQFMSAQDLVEGRFEFNLDNPLTFDNANRRIEMDGTKTDSIGDIRLPAGIDDYDFGYLQAIHYAEQEGYYSANGKNYFIVEDYYSDRATGEIHKFGEFVEIDSSIRLGSSHSHFRDAKYNGEINLDSAAPITTDDIASTEIETDVIINVLSNDSDPDGDALRVDGIVQPIYGQVFDNGDGTITYRPGLEFTGTETFKYWATDGNGNFTPGIVTVTVDDKFLPVVDDIFIGTSVAETFDGGTGSDTVDYSNGSAVRVDLQNDNISGGDAEGDTLVSIENIIGSNSSDNTDRDYIWGDSNTNSIQGMAGNDILEGGAGADIIDGGSGWDYSRYLRSDAGVNINLETGVNTGGHAQGDTLIGIEAIVGSQYDDTIIGGLGNDYLRGENGNDTLRGGASNDQLFGGEGDDIYYYGSGRDTVHEQGTGLDRIIFDAVYDPLSASISGNTIIFDAGVNELILNNIGLFEALSFSGYSDMTWAEFAALTSAVDDIFVGTSVAETFDGGTGNDTVDYSNGSAVRVDLQNSNISCGNAEGDTLVSIENIIGSDNAAERDWIWGDANDNHIQGMAGADILEGDAGADIIDGGSGWDYSRYLRSDAGVNINLETGVNTGGHAQGDILIGIEAIVGSNYNDVIRGGSSNDYLKGEMGDDVLSGGAGIDQLYGGYGADVFLFEAASAFSNADHIRDFKLSENDKLDVSDLLSGYDPLADAISDFVQITDDGTHSTLSVDADGGGDSFVNVATLYNVTGLTDEDQLLADGNLVSV